MQQYLPNARQKTPIQHKPQFHQDQGSSHTH